MLVSNNTGYFKILNGNNIGVDENETLKNFQSLYNNENINLNNIICNKSEIYNLMGQKNW